MRKGYEQQLWNHTALVAYIIARANTDPKKKVHYSDFHPYEKQKRKATLTRERVTDLKAFLPKAKRNG